MKLTRKTFLLTEDQLKKMEALRIQVGTKTLTGVFENALTTLWEKYTKYGKDPFANVTDPNDTDSLMENAERKAKIKVAETKAKQDLLDKPKIDFCINELGGEIIETPEGIKMCTWYNHSMVDDKKQTLPLSQCGKYLLNSKWSPSMKAVLNARPELKEKYKKMIKVHHETV